MVDKQMRGKYTLEYKLEAVRQVKAGQSVTVVGKVLGIPSSSLSKWVRLARLKMERDIAKKAAAYFAQDVLQSTLGSGK